MSCPKCGAAEKCVVDDGHIERSERGVDGDWVEYYPQRCTACGHKWDRVSHCSDFASDDDTVPIRGKE